MAKKYIDADRLREKLQKSKNELEVGNYYLDNSEQAVGYENALVDFELLIDTLQQEQPSDVEEAAWQSAREWKDGSSELFVAPYIRGFKQGAEWAMGQGDSFETPLGEQRTREEKHRIIANSRSLTQILDKYNFRDKVTIQIRKKED